MPFSVEAEIEWLKTYIIPKILKQQKLIANFNDNDFDKFYILNVQVHVVGADESFMLTNCYRTAIEYQFKGVKNTVNLFVKKTPQLSEKIYKTINFNALFSNEILAYEKILPALQEFSNINLKLSKLYFAEVASNYAVVITEDFTTKHWHVCKEMVSISLEHVLLGVEYLAEFHAMGLAWRKRNPQQFAELTGQLKESRYATDLHPSWAITLRESVRRALIATQKYEKSVKESFLANFAKLVGDNYHFGRELVKPREPMITLCHGDYLRNNLAFKYDEEGLPVDIMMFDLQTMRVSSPMIDLSVFLSVSTFAAIRHKHFLQIFTLYFETLRDTYVRLVQEPLPACMDCPIMLQEYLKFLPYSIGVCASFLMSLVEPKKETSQEMLTAQKTEEEILNETMTRGGEVVDRELAHQVKELFEMNEGTAGDIFDHFKNKKNTNSN